MLRSSVSPARVALARLAVLSARLAVLSAGVVVPLAVLWAGVLVPLALAQVFHLVRPAARSRVAALVLVSRMTRWVWPPGRALWAAV